MAAVCIVSALMLASTVASAQKDAKAEAKKHFDAGLALFKAEKYEAAASELEASVRIFPNKGGVFNLASVYKVLSRYDDALAALSRLETEFGDKLDDEMRSASERMRAEIERVSARLEIRISEAGAVVSVDGRKVGKSPLDGPVLLDSGEHVVSAALDGRKDAVAKVKLLAGEVTRVTLELAAKGDEGPGVAPVAVGDEQAKPDAEGPMEGAGVGEEARGERPRKKLNLAPFLVAGGVAVAAGVATAVLGARARSVRDDAVSEHDEALNDEAKGLQTAGRATLGVALGAGVAAVVLAFFTEFERSDNEAPVSVAVAPNGAVIVGRF